MILDVNDIIYYGRYYSCIKNEYDNYWWFDLINYTIVSVDELITDMDFKDYDEICKSEYYIPLFKTDIILLEKQFMLNYHSSKFEKIAKTSLDYDVAFKTFIEYEHVAVYWHEYERSALYSDAVLWCKKNHIAYH